MSNRGVLLQLVARGDDYNKLYHNNINSDKSNEITLFKSKTKKITNFAEAPFSMPPEKKANWGDKVFFKIKKYGDLLGNAYIAFELPEISVTDIIGLNENERNTNYRVRWNEYIGNIAIEYVQLRIGGQIFDKQSGEFLQFYSDLYDTTWSKLCMLGHEKHLILPTTKIDKQYVYVPLKFFFNRDYDKLLPLCALQYHDIEIEVKLRNWDDMYYVLSTVQDETSPTETKTSKIHFAHTNYKLTQKNINNFRLDCNLIFLDKEEREQVSQSRHEFLITQVQELKTTVKNVDRVKLNFQNSIKELIFVLQNQSNINNYEIFNYSGKPQYLPVGTTSITSTLWEQIPNKHLLNDARLLFHGYERVPTRDYKYWHYIQNYENYRNTILHNIYMYNFGLSKSEHTGSCNFNEIEDVVLELSLSNSSTEYIHYTNNDTVNIGPDTTCNFTIYATSYNVIVIDKGLAQLAHPL
jgi:hypothetical protein